jgi:NAD(P)H dehydrogenase (quinone)
MTTTMKTTTAIRRVMVLGANGVQGGAIARALLDEGFAVRGCVRDPAKAGALAAAGAEVVAADLESRRALQQASGGMDAVVLTLPLESSRETVLRWAENAVAAARDAGVGLVILNSGTRIPAEITDVPAFELRRTAEALVRELGPPSIALRPPFFMENLAGPWVTGPMINDGLLAYPMPERLRTDWLSVVDLAGYVAAALRRPDLAGRSMDVGGPETLDGPGVARALAPSVGLPLAYVALAPDAFERGLARQFGPAVARWIARSYHWMAANADSTLFTGAARELMPGLPRPLLPLARWARAQPWPLRASRTA